MDKNEDFYSHKFNVSFETWKTLNLVIAEIDNVLSKKYMKLNQINECESNNKNFDDLLKNARIELVGQIKGLIKSQIIIGKIIVGDLND